MKNIGIICACMLLTAVLLQLCRPKERKVNNALTIVEDHAGDTIKEDDFMSITYTEKAANGTLVSSSSDYDERPMLMFRERSQFKGDFFEMIGHLSEGDSARFTVNADSVRIKSGRAFPPDVKGKNFLYNVRINKVITRGNMNDSSFNAAIEALRKQVIENARQAEPQKIARYIRDHHMLTNKTKSGLQYIVSVQGKGAAPKPGDSVLVNYTGKSLSGKVFETSDKKVAVAAGIYKEGWPYGPARIPVLKVRNISGFLEAAAMFPVGTRATLIIPSSLGYGSDIHNNIQPYTPLVCEISIEDIVPAKSLPNHR